VLPVALERSDADVVLERAPLLVWEVSELHGLEHALDDQGRAETRPEAEEEHAAASVAAERLHRRVVDELHGPAEGPSEVESHPAAAEVVRLRKHMPVDDR